MIVPATAAVPIITKTTCSVLRRNSLPSIFFRNCRCGFRRLPLRGKREGLYPLVVFFVIQQILYFRESHVAEEIDAHPVIVRMRVRLALTAQEKPAQKQVPECESRIHPADVVNRYLGNR